MPDTDRRLAALEARMAAVIDRVERLDERVEQRQERINAFWADRWPPMEIAAGKIDGLEVQLARVQEGQEDALSSLMREIHELGEKQMASQLRPAAPRIWESKHGRWAIRFVCGSAVVCSLALGGLIGADQVLSYVSGVPIAAPVPAPAPASNDGSSGATPTKQPGH